MTTARMCREHRPVLVALVEHGERGPSTAAALAHLETCAACEAEVTGLALTVAALRRAGAAYRRLPPPSTTARPVSSLSRGRVPAARPALHAQPGAAARPLGWAWRLQLGGLAMASAIVAAVVLPHGGLPGTIPSTTTPAAVPAHAPAVRPWQAAELRLATSPDPGSVAMVVPDADSVPPRYPDTLFRPWKEVAAADASVRAREPQ